MRSALEMHLLFSTPRNRAWILSYGAISGKSTYVSTEVGRRSSIRYIAIRITAVTAPLSAAASGTARTVTLEAVHS